MLDSERFVMQCIIWCKEKPLHMRTRGFCRPREWLLLRRFRSAVRCSCLLGLHNDNAKAQQLIVRKRLKRKTKGGPGLLTAILECVTVSMKGLKLAMVKQTHLAFKALACLFP